MLDNLHNYGDFTSFSMNRREPQVNHLEFANDLIIFSGGRKRTIKLEINILAADEAISGQLVNKTKSCFLLDPGAFDS